MSECQVYRREIDESADGGVMSIDARNHFASCSSCGEELRARQSLRALVGGMGKVEAPADFEFRLRARMAAAKRDGGRGRFAGRWLFGFAPVAVAACFVIVSATLYFRQAAWRPTTDTPAVATAPARNAEPDRAPSSNIQSLPAEPKIGEVTQVTQKDAASPETHRAVRSVNVRAAQAREVASQGVRRTEPGSRTLESSVTAAQVIHPISVKASAEPLRVILRDERGAERVVPMRSVSFGSQDFLSRGAATRPPGAVEVGGVW
jgi:hypothetical protein